MIFSARLENLAHHCYMLLSKDMHEEHRGVARGSQNSWNQAPNLLLHNGFNTRVASDGA